MIALQGKRSPKQRERAVQAMLEKRDGMRHWKINAQGKREWF